MNKEEFCNKALSAVRSAQTPSILTVDYENNIITTNDVTQCQFIICTTHDNKKNKKGDYSVFWQALNAFNNYQEFRKKA